MLLPRLSVDWPGAEWEVTRPLVWDSAVSLLRGKASVLEEDLTGTEIIGGDFK